VKVRGERAYARARRGEDFQMPERIVSVLRFAELWRVGEPGRGEPVRAGYEIECGSGTYVRSLIADLDDGYCLNLRRTAIGPFDVLDAVPPPPRGETWSDPPLISLERVRERLGGARPRETRSPKHPAAPG
jgi:tRNA pseudouridine55 synthase